LPERSIKPVKWAKDRLIKVEDPDVIRSSERLVAVDGAAKDPQVIDLLLWPAECYFIPLNKQKQIRSGGPIMGYLVKGLTEIHAPITQC